MVVVKIGVVVRCVVVVVVVVVEVELVDGRSDEVTIGC